LTLGRGGLYNIPSGEVGLVAKSDSRILFSPKTPFEVIFETPLPAEEPETDSFFKERWRRAKRSLPRNPAPFPFSIPLTDGVRFSVFAGRCATFSK
jgi:hypothetical protein